VNPETLQFSAPLTVNWTLSYRCNFACDHCYSREEVCEELPLDGLLKIADILAEAGVLFVNFGGGEPLIDPRLFELSRYAADRGLNVSMNTNGWQLDAGCATQIREAGFTSVGVSVDAHRPELHDDFRNCPGSFERALAALDHLHAAGVRSTMSTVISRLNYRDLDEVLEVARRHRVKQVYLHNFKCSGRGFKNRQELDLSAEEWRAFYVEALEVKARTTDLTISFDDPVIASLPGYNEQALVKGSTCGKLSLHLRPNGDLTPCGFIPVIVGNILTQDFADLWHDSPVLKAMRHKEAQGKCQSCNAFGDCLGGCTARAFATTGDFNQPDPHCWK